MSRAILIDPEACELSYVDLPPPPESSEEIHRLIGNWFESAWMWPDKTVLYVDDEGLITPHDHFFRFLLRSDGQPLAGKGVIVGAEIIDKEGDWIGNRDAMPIESVQDQIRWLTREQAEAWFKANASEPMVTVSTIGRDGRVKTEVLARGRDMMPLKCARKRCPIPNTCRGSGHCLWDKIDPAVQAILAQRDDDDPPPEAA
jgi:hypothetical protein